MKTPDPSTISSVEPLPRRRRRWPYVVLGIVMVVFVMPFSVLAWRLDAWVESAKNDAIPQIEARLGRKVAIGRVKVRVFGGLGAEVHELSVAADPKLPEEKAPLFTLSRAAVDLGVMRTLLSFGKRPTIDSVAIEGTAVNVVRFADGTTNVDHVLRRLEETAPKEEKPDEPMSADMRERVRNARLGSLRVSDLRVVFTDVPRGGAKAEISDVDVAVDGASLSSDWTMKLTAAVLAPQRNLDVAARFRAAPPPKDGGDGVGKGDNGVGAPALAALTVKMSRTDLAPVLPFLRAAAGEAVASLEAAALAIDLGVDAPDATTATKGHVLVSGLRFPGGQSFDARLDVDVRAQPDAGNVDIGRLSVAVGDMSIAAAGKLFALQTAPRFEAFRLTSKALDFDTLRRYYPALDRSAGVTLHGPFSIDGSASGETGKQQFEGRVDLSAASIVVPELLHKPAGTTLALTARGAAAGDAVSIERLLLEIVDWRLLVKGAVKGLSTPAPAFDLTARTDAPTLGGLLRLLPPVAKAIPSGRALGGQLVVDATAKGTAENLAATMKATLTGLDVRVPDAWLSGSGSVTARAEVRGRAPAQTIEANVAVDLDKLEAIYADVLRKTAGTPLSVKLDVDRRGPSGRATTKQTFDANVAGMRAKGHATLVEKGKAQSFDVAVEAEPFSLPAVLALSPSAQATGLGPLRVGGKLLAQGTTNKPESIQVAMPSFTAAAGKSDLRGKLSFSNPDRPVVSLEASSKYLDLEDFLPPAAKGAKPAAKDKGKDKDAAKDAPAGSDDMLKKVTGRARLAVERGRAERIDYQNLRADLELAGGRATAKAMEVDVFGGHFSGSGTELPLTKDGGAFSAKGKLTSLDMDAVLTRFADLPGLLRGRLNADLQLAGQGTEVVDLQKTLEGLLAGSVKDAELGYGTLLGGLRGPLAKAVEIPALSKLLGGADAKLDPSKEKTLGDLATAVRFESGAMRLTKPLSATTPQGPLALDGKITLDGKADLQGTWTLSAAAASALTGNKVKMTEPLSVRLHITGALQKPSVGIANVAEIAKAYVVAYGRSAAGQALQDNAKRGVEAAADRLGVKAKLPEGGAAAANEEAKRREEEARRQATEAQEKARVEAERVRAQADAQRAKAEEEARKRAEDTKKKAQDKLKGILGR